MINRKKRKKHIYEKNISIVSRLTVLAVIFTVCAGIAFAGGGRNSSSGANTAANARPATDREGYAITLPQNINKIVSIGPSNTEILAGLGFGGKIIAADTYSSGVAGLSSNVPATLDILSLDAEYIINLMPDVIFITGMARGGSEDNPLALVSAVGITVIYMPTSVSIAAIMEDIRFIAAVMDAREAGDRLVSNMQAEIDKINRIAAGIREKRKVYFEISAAPWMYSFGSGTFLNEMIELTGAVNVFKDQTSWISVSDEALLAANPDVILTSVDYLDDPINEILRRPGFGAITAVRNRNVFRIDTASSNRPSQNIIKALNEIARAVYPEYYR